MSEEEIIEKNLPETEITRMKIEQIQKYESEAKNHKDNSYAYAFFVGMTFLFLLMNGSKSLEYFRGDKYKLYYIITTFIYALCTSLGIKELASEVSKKNIIEDKIETLKEQMQIKQVEKIK